MILIEDADGGQQWVASTEGYEGATVLATIPDDARPQDYTWNGSAVVFALGTAKANRLQAVSTRFSHVLSLGCVTPKGRADCDDKAQQRITSAVLLADKAAELGVPEAATPWTMFDGSVEPHSRAELVALGLAIGAQMQACFARKQELQAAIGAAADQAALTAINIEAGWPGQEG